MKKFKKHIMVSAILLIILISSVSVFAQKNQEEKKTKFGIGLQNLSPAWGISGMLDITPDMSIQGIIDPLGNLKMYTGKGIYRFKKGPSWSAYGYGMAGAWSHYPYYDVVGWNVVKKTETIVGFGAGAGIEYDWRGLSADFSNFPLIWWNIEIGLGKIDFKKSGVDFSGIMIGGGLHYRF